MIGLTYDVVGTAAHHFELWGQNAKFFFVDRFLHLEYVRGSAKLDLDVNGPLVGIGFDF